MKVDRLLESYCTMDSGTKSEMLATVKMFMKQRGKVIYGSKEYHNIKDLEISLEASCKTEQVNEVQQVMF